MHLRAWMSIFSISASSSSSLLPNVSFFSSKCCYSFLTPPTHNHHLFLPIAKSTKKKPIGVTMSMEAGIEVMATKVGMMSFFQPSDKVVPVTDGYDAVQVGYCRVKDLKHKWVISREGQKSCLGRK
ncbi:hypothetical protein L3X38_040931 [Prunus dulcis]|uniref:Uncharacterized protein n=1 Tax=Prunus dulcis TaxID=3755 RepID=A0AAD4UT28_PRUDU|nr:hypothetical protein L3X38_040931 [Prunus dulcis]